MSLSFVFSTVFFIRSYVNVCAHPGRDADEVYILMRNAPGKYLKYADLEFQDLAKEGPHALFT